MSKRTMIFFVLIKVMILLLVITGCSGSVNNVSGSSDKSGTSNGSVNSDSSANGLPAQEDFLQEGSQSFCAESIIEEGGDYLVVLDDAGRTVRVPKNPERTMLMLNSFLNLWYVMGGEAVARVSGEDRIPPAAEALPDLGTFASVDLEQLVALELDLVILSSRTNSHQNILTALESNDISVLALAYQDYGDTLRLLELFARINGRLDLFKERALAMAESVEEFLGHIPEKDNPSAVILFATSRSVSVETPYTSTGEMLSMLKVRNIVECEEQMVFATNNRVPFSMENIVAEEPDYILVSLMGDEEKARQALEKEIQDNPAWNQLSAVKEGRLVFLPKKWFVFKPGVEMLEALKYLAEIIYPEVDFN